MERIEIMFFTDNESGKRLASKIELIGVKVNIREFSGTIDECSNSSDCSVLIFELNRKKPSELIRQLSEIRFIEHCVKFIITGKEEADGIFSNDLNRLNFEIITKPVDDRSFLLLLEKTLLVEKYKNIMKQISDESQSRIGILESMIDMKRRNIYSGMDDQEIFIKILDFEKKMMQEQINLNDSIRNIAICRNSEYMALKDRVKAEEMLGELRREELINADRIIKAQESLIEYSSKELLEIKRIIEAKDNVEELSRVEAIDLRKELEKLKNEKKILEEKIELLNTRFAGGE